MTGIIIKVLLGLFVWMLLPQLIYKKRRPKKKSPQHFVGIACKIVGVAVIVFAVIDLIKLLLTFSLP
ncbi:MAG: hypothetical protein LBR34_04195 [Prevotella sp.]|jgi:hypothetical protein|nr:hypothetical protein [Prevotella sp.]